MGFLFSRPQVNNRKLERNNRPVEVYNRSTVYQVYPETVQFFPTQSRSYLDSSVFPKRTKSYTNEQYANEVSEYYKTLNKDILKQKQEPNKNKNSNYVPKVTILSTKESSLKNEASWIVDEGQSTDDSTEFEETDPNILVHGLPCIEWTDEDYVSEMAGISRDIARNLIRLFKEENTIPFIARYRKSATGGMEAEALRQTKEIYDRSKIIRHKAATIIKTIDKQGKWTPDIHAIIKSTKSLNDLEHIYSMFKAPSKRSLAERARELGLGPVAASILEAKCIPDLSTYVNFQKEGLKSQKEVKDNIVYIIADNISKDKTLFEKIRELRKFTKIQIETSEGKAAKEQAAKAEEGVRVPKGAKAEKSNLDAKKYEIYFDFKSNESSIKPHQILAINRGESHKFLSVKIIIPASFERDLKNHVLNLHSKAIRCTTTHATFIKDGFDHSYKKSIKPAIIRRFRNEMNEKAEIASIEVFAMNLKQLILTPPFKGKPVLGIDPGFYHGCKVAVVSENGDVLKTDKIYPHSEGGRSKDAESILVGMIRNYQCTSIALGNGTACRETEVFLGKLIKAGAFAPFEVSYTIINEAGASIYSCSEEAKSEFPTMDPNLISAVSIARRLQDPLAELVKVEPKHLGVGMYQHDVPEKQLDLTLNEVITEAVSFVGVDINTASLCILKKIAGLNATKAKNILEWRKKNGSFINREQLLDVKGIGNKSYEQCAGFIRILPETALVTDNKTRCKKLLNYLDQTWIHPESYKIAEAIVKSCNCRVEDLGNPSFTNAVNSYARQGFETLAKKFKSDDGTIEIIVKGLTMGKGYDIRSKRDKPLFRRSLTGIESLSPGVTLRGVVRNVTHFGAFADVGVCRDGLIPTRFMKGQTLSIGQNIEVKVLKVEREMNRFSIELVQIL